MLGLLGEHFALQDDAPDAQTTGKDADVFQAVLDAPRGALTCLNNLEPFDQNDKITEGGRSQFPAPATGLTLDSSCCAELGGRSPDDYLPSKASQVPGDDALGFRPPKLPPSRIACSPHTSPSLGTLKFSPDRFLCGDCPLRFSPVPDLSLVPTPRSCWLAPQQPVQSCGTGAFDNAVLRCPCLDTAPESGLHACLPGVIGGPDWPKDPILGEPVHCKQRRPRINAGFRLSGWPSHKAARMCFPGHSLQGARPTR